MSEFDDPSLRDRLSRYAGAPPDGDAAYVGVQQRVRHIKRRRAAIWSGAAVIVIGVGAANALQGPDGAKVTVPPTASTPVANTVATTSTTSTTAVTTTAVATTAIETTQPAAPEVTNPEAALGTPDSGNADAATGGAPPTASATPSRPAALPADGEEHHRSAAGGTLAVRLANGSLSLVSATPSDGFAARVDDDTGSRIRVVFERRAASSVVTATLVGGEIRFRVWERGGDQDDASQTSVSDDRDRDRDDRGNDNDDDRDDGRDDDRRDRRDDGADNSRDRPGGDGTDGTDD